jgi:hypothetical protein
MEETQEPLILRANAETRMDESDVIRSVMVLIRHPSLDVEPMGGSHCLSHVHRNPVSRPLAIQFSHGI